MQNQTEDSIRKELIALQEDKHNYETTAKESLRRVLQEKIEVVRKLSEVEVLKFHVWSSESAEIVVTTAIQIPALLLLCQYLLYSDTCRLLRGNVYFSYWRGLGLSNC